MFWSKKSAAGPSTNNNNNNDEFNPSTLEQGKNSDRRSSFSSASSADEKYPSTPDRAHLASHISSAYSHGELSSVGQLSSVGTTSLPTFNDSRNRRSRSSRGPPGFFRRYWFFITLAVLAVIGLSCGIALALMNSSKEERELILYVPEDSDGNVFSETVFTNALTLGDALSTTQAPEPTEAPEVDAVFSFSQASL